MLRSCGPEFHHDRRMIALLQRVSSAQVEVSGERVGAIGHGLLALIGVQPRDDERTAGRLLERMLAYRVFGDEQGGLMAPPGDERAFAAKLGELIGSAELRARQGAAARERVVRDYDARTQTRIVEETYLRLLGVR